MYSTKRILTFLFLPLPLMAQQEETLPLDTILKRIENSNPLLKSYQSRAESYQYKADASTAWMAPMAGGGTYMTPYPGSESFDKGSLMFSLEQDIPNPAKQKAQKRYIESQAGIVNAAGDIALNDLKASAKNLYYSWLIASRKIGVLKENEKILQTIKKIEEVRYPYNQSNLSGIYLAEAKIAENQNQIRMQHGDIAKSRARLNSLMDRPGNTDFKIDTTLVPSFNPASLDTAFLAEKRKDIFQLEQNIRSMNLNLEAVKVQRKPDFSIRFDHMSPLSSGMPNAYSIMGMVSIPIAPWSAKAYKSEAKAMQFEIQAMEQERRAMLRQSQGTLTGMQQEIASAEQRIKAMEEKIIPSLKKAMDVNFLNYQENKLGLTAVMDSWETLNMMRLQLLDEELKLYQLIADYEKETYR